MAATSPGCRAPPRRLDFPWLLLRLGPAGGGRAFGVLSVWLGWEALTAWWWRLRPIRPGSVLRYRVLVHRGPPLSLADGTVVRPGDRVVDLHLDNRALTRMLVEERATPWSLLRRLKEDLAALLRLGERGKLGEVRALYGMTLFAEPARRLGFEVRPLPRTWRWALVHFYLVGLVALYHPEGWRRAARLRDRLWPGQVWMSWAALRRLRAEKEAARKPPAPPLGGDGRAATAPQ